MTHPVHVFRFVEFQAALVESGQKRCTIRLPRKRVVAPGDTLRLTGPTWQGPGKPHPQPNRLLKIAACRDVFNIELRFAPDGAVKAAEISSPWRPGLTDLRMLDVDELARMDGFRDRVHMGRSFAKWHGPEPFKGILIRW